MVKSAKNKNKRNLIIFTSVLVLAMILILLLNAGFLQTAFGYTVVYKQNWGSIECVQEDDYDYQTRYIDDITLSKCDQYTNECEYTFTNTRGSGFGAIAFCYNECDLNGQNCLGQVCKGWGAIFGTGETYEKTIKQGRSLKFTSGAGWQYVTFEKKWKNFYIRGKENGKIFVQDSCILNSDLRKRVLADGLNELARSGANSFQNYLIDFVQVATKTYSYNGNEVICQARVLFDVTEQTFKDGTTAKFQSNMITGVECCPTEANCDPNTFTFEEEVPPRECFISSECANGGQPIATGGTTYIKYTCSNAGECVQSSNINTECTNNAVCIMKYGSNYICNLSTINWGNCKKVTGPIGYCGDGICEDVIGETKNSCPEDCGYIGNNETNSTECTSCFSWLNSKTLNKDSCDAKVYYEKTWYNPGTWILPEGGITQDSVCPIFLGILVLIAALVFLVMVLFVKVIDKKNKIGEKK